MSVLLSLLLSVAVAGPPPRSAVVTKDCAEAQNQVLETGMSFTGRCRGDDTLFTAVYDPAEISRLLDGQVVYLSRCADMANPASYVVTVEITVHRFSAGGGKHVEARIVNSSEPNQSNRTRFGSDGLYASKASKCIMDTLSSVPFPDPGYDDRRRLSPRAYTVLWKFSVPDALGSVLGPMPPPRTPVDTVRTGVLEVEGH